MPDWLLIRITSIHQFLMATRLSNDDAVALFPWTIVAQRCELLWRFGLVNRMAVFLVQRVLPAIQRSLNSDKGDVAKRLFWTSFLANLVIFFRSALIVPAHGLAIGRYNPKLPNEAIVQCRYCASAEFRKVSSSSCHECIFDAQLTYISKQSLENIRKSLIKVTVVVLLRIVGETIAEFEVIQTYRNAFPLMHRYRMPASMTKKLTMLWLTVALKDAFNQLLDISSTAFVNVPTEGEVANIFPVAMDVLRQYFPASKCLITVAGVKSMLAEGEAAFRSRLRRLAIQSSKRWVREMDYSDQSLVYEGMPQGIFLRGEKKISALSVFLMLGKLVQLEALVASLRQTSTATALYSALAGYYLLLPPQILHVLSKYKDVEKSVFYAYHRNVVQPWRRKVMEMSRIGSLYRMMKDTKTHPLESGLRTSSYKREYPPPTLLSRALKYHEMHGAFEPPLKESVRLCPGALYGFETDI